MPTPDQDGWELVIFKQSYCDEDLSYQTLPRTFIARSLLECVSFRDTDLHGSGLCWNDFHGCDFSQSELSHADLRASIFRNCDFTDCYLVRADLRRSRFENCDFSGANFCRAKLTRAQARTMNLSAEQQKFVRWQRDDGPEPQGG